METVINLLAKFSGFNAVWNFLDGKKAYGTCALGVLTGATALAAQAAPIMAAHNTAGLLTFLSGLATNPAALMIVGSCGAVAKLHRDDKKAANAELEKKAAAGPTPKDPEA